MCIKKRGRGFVSFSQYPVEVVGVSVAFSSYARQRCGYARHSYGVGHCGRSSKIEINLMVSSATTLERMHVD